MKSAHLVTTRVLAVPRALAPLVAIPAPRCPQSRFPIAARLPQTPGPPRMWACACPRPSWTRPIPGSATFYNRRDVAVRTSCAHRRIPIRRPSQAIPACSRGLRMQLRWMQAPVVRHPAARMPALAVRHSAAQRVAGRAAHRARTRGRMPAVDGPRATTTAGAAAARRRGTRPDPVPGSSYSRSGSPYRVGGAARPRVVALEGGTGRGRRPHFARTRSREPRS